MSEYVKKIAAAVKQRVPNSKLETIESVIRIHRNQWPGSWQEDCWAMDFDVCVESFTQTMRDAINARETAPARIALLHT